MRLRILSFNVNGLRSILYRSGGLARFLDSLGADIICLQEHKLRRDELVPELAITPGWESFFTFNRTGSGKGYSGVCTYVRKTLTPSDAHEGMTGFLQLDRSIPKSRAPTVLGPPWEEYSAELLESLDAEGRCVITDHSAFVLFNIYGPAITSEERADERMAYKRAFYTALDMRVRRLLSSNRRVLVVGDLNISPAPLDSCDPSFTDERFFERWDRGWLRTLLGAKEPGQFRDTFRMFHPDRAHAYTCWSTASSARIHNWGTRIDLLLAADGSDPTGSAVHQWVVDGDIMPEVQGSDHCPAWVDLHFPEGVPCASTLPRASSRSLFDASCIKQATLTSFFAKQPPPPQGQGPQQGQAPQAQRQGQGQGRGIGVTDDSQSPCAAGTDAALGLAASGPGERDESAFVVGGCQGGLGVWSDASEVHAGPVRGGQPTGMPPLGSPCQQRQGLGDTGCGDTGLQVAGVAVSPRAAQSGLGRPGREADAVLGKPRPSQTSSGGAGAAKRSSSSGTATAKKRVAGGQQLSVKSFFLAPQPPASGAGVHRCTGAGAEVQAGARLAGQALCMPALPDRRAEGANAGQQQEQRQQEQGQQEQEGQRHYRREQRSDEHSRLCPEPLSGSEAANSGPSMHAHSTQRVHASHQDQAPHRPEFVPGHQQQQQQLPYQHHHHHHHRQHQNATQQHQLHRHGAAEPAALDGTQSQMWCAAASMAQAAQCPLMYVGTGYGNREGGPACGEGCVPGGTQLTNVVLTSHSTAAALSLPMNTRDSQGLEPTLSGTAAEMAPAAAGTQGGVAWHAAGSQALSVSVAASASASALVVEGPDLAGSVAAKPFQFAAVPRCHHNEPAVPRVVKKKGLNRGREFYCCGRPDGPKPQGRCDYFRWRYPQASDQPASKKPRPS